MTIELLENRLSAIENELTEIKQLLVTEKPETPLLREYWESLQPALMLVDKDQPASHRWEKVFGSFANSEGFEEAVRLGREYRESLRPDDYEGAN